MNARVTCVRSFTLHANDSQKYSRLVRTESKCKLIIDLSDILCSRELYTLPIRSNAMREVLLVPWTVFLLIKPIGEWMIVWDNCK